MFCTLHFIFISYVFSCLQSFLRAIESEPSSGRSGGSLSGAHRLLGDLSVAEQHPERAIASYAKYYFFSVIMLYLILFILFIYILCDFFLLSRAFEHQPEPNANLIPKSEYNNYSVDNFIVTYCNLIALTCNFQVCDLLCSTWQPSYLENAKVNFFKALLWINFLFMILVYSIFFLLLLSYTVGLAGTWTLKIPERSQSLRAPGNLHNPLQFGGLIVRLQPTS